MSFRNVSVYFRYYFSKNFNAINWGIIRHFAVIPSYDALHSQRNSAKMLKKYRNYKPKHISGPDDTKELRYKIFKANTVDDIWDIILSNNINDVSVYGAIFKRCNEKKYYNLAVNVMEYCIKNNIMLTDIECTIFVSVMINGDKMYCVKQYFKSVFINQFNINVSKFLLTNVIKGCKKRIGRYYDFLEYILNYGKENGIEYDDYMYNEIIGIYVKLKKYSNMDQLFDDFIKSKYNNEFINYTTFLNAYANIGNITKMKEIFNIIKEIKPELNIVIYTVLMKGYIKCGKYKKALNIYEKYILTQFEIDINVLKNKCMAYLFMQYYSDNINDQLNAHNIIMNEISNEYYQIKKSRDSWFITKCLISMILKYHNSQPNKISNYFKKNFGDGKVVYTSYLKNMNIYCIDLHCFDLLVAQYILRYVFAFELENNIFNQQNDVHILCGKQTHSISNDNSMLKFIFNEIKNWGINPEIIMDSFVKISHIDKLKCINDKPTLKFIEYPSNINDWDVSIFNTIKTN